MATIRPEWRALVALALGCGLRFGELVAPRRSDVDLKVAVGHPINFHDLRATGATRRAQRGAHVAKVQAFLGDSSSQAAERYIRATQSRMDDLTALAFDGLDFGGVTR